MNSTQVNNAIYIFRELAKAGLTYEGIGGLMGNLWNESGLLPGNIENWAEKKLGMTEAEYAAKVDRGEITRDQFVRPSVGQHGIGIVQWTYYTRRAGLYDYCKARGLSIASLEGQVGFMIEELKGYKGVWKVLTTTNTLKEASDIVLTGYEKPVDQSENAKAKRTASGESVMRELAMHGYNSALDIFKPVDEDGVPVPQPQPVVDYKSKYEALLSKIKKIAEEG